jgi:hypothetical protein
MTNVATTRPTRVSRIELFGTDPHDLPLQDVREKWGTWIEGNLGCSFDELAILEYPFPFDAYLVAEMFQKESTTRHWAPPCTSRSAGSGVFNCHLV